MRLTCLPLSLSLTRLVVSLGLASSVAVMLTRERQNQKHRMRSSCLLLLHKGKHKPLPTSHSSHMKTPQLHASHHLKPHSATEQISISSAFDHHFNKSHWKSSLIVQTRITDYYYTHNAIKTPGGSIVAYSDHRLPWQTKFSLCTLPFKRFSICFESLLWLPSLHLFDRTYRKMSTFLNGIVYIGLVSFNKKQCILS